MATGYINLVPTSASTTNPAALSVLPSGRRKWLFDAVTDEMVLCEFRMPGNYASSPVLKLQYSMASATSGNVVLGAEVMAVTPGDAANINTDSFDIINTATSTVPATTGHMKEVSITLANADDVAAGDYVVIRIRRDADSASDTAVGDLELWTIMLEYTTA
jgi:hypothetical protein